MRRWVSGVCRMVVGLACMLLAAPSMALQLPHPVATDARLKTVRYSPNEVYKFTGYYGYQSVIEFGEGEVIQTVSIGDSIAWQLTPQDNKLFIKPVEQDALTNMTVITSRGMYFFELHADDPKSESDENLTFLLHFIYPDDTGGISDFSDGKVPDFTDPEVYQKLNFKYTVAGPDFNAPLRVFDDGEFTYFQFKNKNAEVPAFFYVDPDGSEGIINYRTRGDYIVIERVAPVFTLRNGSYVHCVFNENMPMPPRIAPVDERHWYQKLNPFGSPPE